MTIQNDSKTTVFVAVAGTDNLDYAVEASVNQREDKYFFTKKIASHESDHIRAFSSDLWETIAEHNSGNLLYFFVISEKTIEGHDWETIKEEKLYEIFTKSIKQLNESNWIVNISGNL
jgi:hypothetical protein